jgi:mannose-6-phosphate isomerase class I
MSRGIFRVRPWFEPGAWGGQWIKHNIPGISPDAANYAWSFELIVPENGLMLGSSGRMLEVSFDTLMFHAGENVVGQACYKTYGDEFPIRMDYLDNKKGGNLSIQCHPQREYCRRMFGEVLTQEETYYMMHCWDDAVVYLGFKEDIDPAAFEKALTESHRDNTPLDVPRYVNSIKARQHDLYLMPPGTLHSSGRDNLVLEISTTPYIFTFKMYDWLTLDMDGMPRPLNIRRAMENVDFERKGKAVDRTLVSRPALLEEGDGFELWHLPTHEDHSYDVHRFHLTGSASVTTEGKCHVINLVEGNSIEINTASGMRYVLHYAETAVIPAAAGSYTITNTDGGRAMVVKAFMKDDLR